MIKKHLNNIPFFFFSFFLFVFPLSERFSTILALLIGLITLLNIKKTNFKALRSYVYIFGLYIVYVFLEFLYTGNVFNSNLEQKASFILFPLFFSIFFFTKEQHHFFAKSLVFGSIISVFFIMLKTFLIEYAGVITTSKTAIYNTKDFFLNSFDWHLPLDPIYQSLFYLLSIAYILYNRLLKRFTNIIALVLLILGVYFTQSVFGLLSLVFLIVYFFLRSKIILLLSSILVFCVFVFKTGFYIPFMETRIVLWENALKLIKKNFIFGYGSTNSQKVMDNSFYNIFIASDSSYLNLGLNSHNQYLQLFLEGGLLFFVLFLLLFSPFYKMRKIFDNNKFYELTIIIFLLIMLVECVFERYIGIALFSAFYCLILNYSFTNEKNY